MKIFVPLTAAVGLSIAVASPPTLRRLDAVAFKMTPVRSIQARVQGDKPKWDATSNAFVFQYGNDSSTWYRAGLDTVNTASVEGALMYVQAEGIDYRTQSVTCVRKNKMKYVVFYDVTIAQPEEAVAEFKTEYGPYSAMDGGQCTPINGTGATAVFSQACNYFNGTNGEPKIGAYVGGEDRSTDKRALYPNTMWFSFPNTCPLQPWSGKTDACRASTPAGLCPFGATPDGVKCTFSYKVLGWIPIDDLVGITAMKNKAGTATYTNFSQFCTDGQVEYKTDTNGTLISSIDFWKAPSDKTANAARAAQVVSMYNTAVAGPAPGLLTQVTTDEVSHFVALPTIAKLTEDNPACYKNVPTCSATSAPHGCKRDLYSQLCTPCDADIPACVKAPADYAFGTLVQATPVPTTAAPTANTTTTPTSTPTTTPSATKSAASSLSLSVVSVASVAMSLALSFVLA